LAATVLSALWCFAIGESAVALSALVLLAAIIGWYAVAHRRSSVRGAGMALLGAAFLAPALWEIGHTGDDGGAANLVVRLSCAAAAALLLIRSGRSEPALQSRGLSWAAGSLLAGSLLAPSGGAGIVGLSATAATHRQPALLIFGMMTAVWSVSRFYYDLDLPLDRKALVMAAGATLSAVAWIVLFRPSTSAMPHARTVAVLLVCAAVPAVFEYADAVGKARVVAAGREVLLPMGPRDPRSLIQGDYMALRYDPQLFASLPKRGGDTLLTVDDGNIARAARAAQGEARPDEVMVRARPGRVSAHIAPDSFLFEEGYAEEWAKARFVVTRILNGELVVVGLADSDRKLIGPKFAENW